jgi:hypothetical protein
MSDTTSRLGHCTTTYGHSPACLRDGTYCSSESSHAGPCKPHGAAPAPSKLEQIAAAQRMRAEGASLFEIARTLGVTKEWLRTYAI